MAVDLGLGLAELGLESFVVAVELEELVELGLDLHFEEAELGIGLVVAAAVGIDLEVAELGIDLEAVLGTGLVEEPGTVLDPAGNLVDNLVVVDLVDGLEELDLEDSTVADPGIVVLADGRPAAEHKPG